MTAQGLYQRQSQLITIAPYMKQSLKILQATAQELRTEILEELEINPVLEEDPALEGALSNLDEHSGDDLSESFDEDDRLSSFEQAYGKEPLTAESSEHKQALIDSVVREDSLEDHLMNQVRFMQLSQKEQQSLLFLIGSLDEKGFLSSPLSEIAHLSHFDPVILAKMLKVLQSLDPCGIGAQNLRESLLIQLRAGKNPSLLALSIVEDHYDLLMRRRIPDLVKALGGNAPAVHEALEAIALLDPAPARRFSEDTNRAITADVHIESDSASASGWRVRLENACIPRMRISEKYRNPLAHRKLSSQKRDYIREKIQSAKQLIRAIDERQSTIAKIAKVILKEQREFFENGANSLKPLTLRQVAKEAGLHETSVSRALMNKYLSCQHGVFSFNCYF